MPVFSHCFLTPQIAFSDLHVRTIAACCCAAALAGCGTTARIEPDGSLVRHYLGYVKVVVPQAASRNAVYTSDVSVIGLRVGNGVGVGYSRDRQVVVPLDCRLAVMVANQAQLDEALARLPALLDRSGVCAVINPSLD